MRLVTSVSDEIGTVIRYAPGRAPVFRGGAWLTPRTPDPAWHECLTCETSIWCGSREQLCAECRAVMARPDPWWLRAAKWLVAA